MRLAFHYHSVAIQKGDNIFTPSYLGLFIDSLAAEVEEIICFMHSPRSFEVAAADYTIKSDNVKLVDLGIHSSLPERLMSMSRYKKIVSRYEDQFEIMLIRTPTPLTFALTKAHSKPVVYYVVGDYVEGAKTLTLPAWKSALIKGYAAYFNKRLVKVLKDRVMVANSKLLFDQLKDKAAEAHLVKSTTLSTSDIFVQEDSMAHADPLKELNILFTGRITPSKGLEDIIEASGLLIRQEGYKINFHIAGMVGKEGDEFIIQLKNQAKKYEGNIQVIFHGKLMVGDELNALYRKCHIFVLASRGDFEGFPRVLWEAMANSLPVLATKVGSIPYFLENEKHALLVPPNEPEEFAKALNRIVRDSGFRKELIQHGRELAKTNTLEKRAHDMVEILRSVRNRGSES